VKEFFYAPAQGLMVSPEAFGQGLAEGSMSLLKHSVSGVGTAVGGVFASGGKAAAALSLDQDFITRTSIRNAQEPEHVGQGVAQGARTLASGIKEGITGLVRDPVQGAKERGVKGFLRGLGTGIMGAVAKPVAGALSMVAQTSKGIANTGDYVSDGPRMKVQHLRAKRYISPSDNKITIYDAAAAEEALEDRKVSAADVKHKLEKQEKRHEASSRIQESVDAAYGKHSNPAMTEALRDDNRKVVKDEEF
jgi:hypothetical protein